MQNLRRLTRTVLLGTVALAVALWWLVREFEVDIDTLLDYILASGVLVLGVVGAALLLVVVIKLMRR